MCTTLLCALFTCFVRPCAPHQAHCTYHRARLSFEAHCFMQLLTNCAAFSRLGRSFARSLERFTNHSFPCFEENDDVGLPTFTPSTITAKAAAESQSTLQLGQNIERFHCHFHPIVCHIHEHFTTRRFSSTYFDWFPRLNCTGCHKNDHTIIIRTCSISKQARWWRDTHEWF